MATSKNFHMELEDSEFSCPLCLEIFVDPKSFPNCAHNICKSCLSNMLAFKKDVMHVICPVCRQTSPLPVQGVDGFPTNTLIVRLVEKIPGIKDKKDIGRAVSRCKDEIERNKKMLENMEQQLAVVNRNKLLGKELKKQISTHAKESVEIIRSCEAKMLKEVDDFVAKHCGLTIEKEIEKEMDRLKNYLLIAQNCVLNVEDTINKDDLDEISVMKEVIQAQLTEYSKYPEPHSLKHAMNIRSFDMTFEKNYIQKDALGKVVSKSVTKHDPQLASLANVTRSESSHAPSSQETRTLTNASRLDPQHTESTSTDQGAISSLRLVGSTHPWIAPIASSFSEEANSSSDNGSHAEFLSEDFKQLESHRNVLHYTDLPFCPTKIAVCPISNDIALLWKENRKVFIYDADAEYQSTIQIMYGDLSDVGFCSLGNVVVVNRESNRLLFYDKDGTFYRRKVKIPDGNFKFTYLSCHEDFLTVVSAQLDDDCEWSDSVTKCVILYKTNGSSLLKVFGENQFINPLSRAVYHHGKIYVADSREFSYGYEPVIKVFTKPTFELAQMVLDTNVITSHIPIDFVSLFHEDNCTLFGVGQAAPFLCVGCPGIEDVYVFDRSHNYVGIRATNVNIKQQETIDGGFISMVHDLYPDNPLIQVEIYPNQNSFEIVYYEVINSI